MGRPIGRLCRWWLGNYGTKCHWMGRRRGSLYETSVIMKHRGVPLRPCGWGFDPSRWLNSTQLFRILKYVHEHSNTEQQVSVFGLLLYVWSSMLRPLPVNLREAGHTMLKPPETNKYPKVKREEQSSTCLLVEDLRWIIALHFSFFMTIRKFEDHIRTRNSIVGLLFFIHPETNVLNKHCFGKAPLDQHFSKCLPCWCYAYLKTTSSISKRVRKSTLRLLALENNPARGRVGRWRRSARHDP